MLVKKIGAIIYFKDKDKVYFLILHRVLRWNGWEILKGSIKKNETALQALKRELKEEIDIKKFKVIKKINKQIKFKWDYHDVIIDDIFLVKIDKDSKIVLNNNTRKEHNKYLWVSKQKDIKMLTWNNTKSLLKGLNRKLFK
ncbi:MAG: NUDIX domain-containing protein [Candidatus Woesearchaeota archaeon]|nr:NUDIX domain-containing protein [Candidatus Woesearchaeota archaeon]